MKTLPITFLFFLLSLGSFAQVKKSATKKPAAKKQTTSQEAPKKEEARTDNFVVTETQEARFNGTDEQLVMFFMENVKFDSSAVKANAEGQVMLSFMVNPDSSVTNPTVIQKFGYDVDDQVAKLVTRLKFVPAKMNGVVIRSNHIVSIPLRAYFH
jgi:TonB family protein